MNERDYARGRFFEWVFLVFGFAFGVVAFYSLDQKIDAIEVEPIVRLNSNDSELEEKVRLYEELLMGLLVCTDVQ